MDNLFSSEPAVRHENSGPTPEEQQKKDSFPTPKLVVEKKILLNAYRNSELISGWCSPMNTENIVSYVTLSKDDVKYKQVDGKFQDGTRGQNFQVSKIERVENPYLMQAFLLKKEELKQKYSSMPSEDLYFHGTKEANVDAICRHNFDWRKRGSNRGHIFGKGVSFTPISFYATHYGDETSTFKVMLVVRVLVCNKSVGTKNTVLPPEGYDTTAKPNGQVIVKYEDNEFYPAYKVTYYQQQYDSSSSDISYDSDFF